MKCSVWKPWVFQGLGCTHSPTAQKKRLALKHKHPGNFSELKIEDLSDFWGHTNLLLFTSRREMKSLASSEMSANSASSKLHWHARMLFSVSLSSSPRNGDKPLSLHMQTQVSITNRSPFGIIWLFIDVCGLTACKWWHLNSTYQSGMRQIHSWWLQEPGTQVCQSSPSTFPWVYIWKEDEGEIGMIKAVDTWPSVNTDTETNTNLLASPKSIIFTLFVCRLTQRIFSGCWQSKHRHFKLLVMQLLKCILLTRMCLVPLGQGVICTSCAYTEALHWSVWWTALCPSQSTCSSRLWSGQTALHHQH